MVEGIISVFDGFNTAHESYKRISGMIRGDKDKSAQYLETVCEHLGGIRTEFERLSDRILYAPSMQAVHDITQSKQKVEDLRHVREYLEPVQKVLDEDILSSAIVLTPDRMQQALNKSPWEVLIDVRPVSLASKPDNPDLLPILFTHNGMQYIGWQMRGTLPILFNCEFDELWLPDKAVKTPPVSSTPTQIDRHDASYWFNQGNSLADLGKYEEAIVSYDKALQIKPDYDDAWNNCGISLRKLGKYEEAIASYDKALQIKPDDHEAWNNRGVSLDNLGKYEKAIASYDKALQIKPDYELAKNNRKLALKKLDK